MQHINFHEEIIQHKTLERRNEELLKLLDAWQMKSQIQKPKFLRSLNIHEIENLIIRFYQVYKVPVSLYDEEDRLLFSIGWKNVCQKYHKNAHQNLRSCQKNIIQLNNRMADVNSYSFKCRNNFNAVAIPVTIRKERLGTLLIDQFLYDGEVPDLIRMQEIAFENGINFGDYRKAVNELPVLSSAEVEKMTEHYILFSEMISFIASHNVHLQEQQDITREKNEIISIFREKLEEQSLMIKSIYQILLQQSHELELVKDELEALRRAEREYKEKSLAESQPG